MRTNIELDESLIKQALKISGFRTKKDIVNEALKQYVASLKRRNIGNSWRGHLVWESTRHAKHMNEPLLFDA